MATANFWTMRDFPLYAKSYWTTVKTCPECGETIWDTGTAVCDSCGCAELDEELFYDDAACECERDEIMEELDDFNYGLLFFQVSLRSGYYDGVQFYVETEHDLDKYEYDNDDCYNYFDCCRSIARRKYQAEKRKIIRKLAALSKAYGFGEYVVAARFSSGEVLYSEASSPRAAMYAAIA